MRNITRQLQDSASSTELKIRQMEDQLLELRKLEKELEKELEPPMAAENNLQLVNRNRDTDNASIANATNTTNTNTNNME